MKADSILEQKKNVRQFSEPSEESFSSDDEVQKGGQQSSFSSYQILNTGPRRELNLPRTHDFPAEGKVTHETRIEAQKDETIELLQMELAERDLKVQRLRQEKLGMLLKCFTEMSTLQDTLRSVISSTDTGSKHKQQDSKLMLDSK